MESFADRLFASVRRKESCVVVGMDPDLRRIPRGFFPDPLPSASVREALARGVERFAEAVLTAVADSVVAVKPQLAYFERLGPAGLAAYEHVCRVARGLGLWVIADGKRNDIAATAAQYAAAYLGAASERGEPEAIARADEEGPKADALTVNPYLGWDGIEPFLPAVEGGRGVFVLVKTSNPSSGDLQDLPVGARPGGQGGEEAAECTVASAVGGWLEAYDRERAGSFGYGSVGAVVGATYPKDLAALRRAMPHVPFLLPGYGAQGAGAREVAPAFDAHGLGAVVNASRSILYAHEARGTSVEEAARAAALEMRDELRRVAPLSS